MKTDASNKSVWQTLHGKEKLQYIFDYYKLPIVITLILLYIIISILYGLFTHKEPILYLGLVNVNPSQTLTTQLTEDYLKYSKQTSEELQLYTGLYLTNDPNNPYLEYTYASQMKIIASVENQAFDIIFMNKEAFDAFSQSGYLCDLEQLFKNHSLSLYNKLQPYLTDNVIILEDNAIEVSLDNSISYQAKTEIHPYGLDLSQKGLLSFVDFNDTIYLGVIENSPRKQESLDYIQYIFAYGFEKINVNSISHKNTILYSKK